MRYLLASAFLVLAACGGATDTAATRYNFAVVDGRNQAAAAGTSTLAEPITAQLTRDPQGKFATRVFDFFAPAIAYAQSISLAGEPVANTIVCGRESSAGEPKVVPLCAYTLADGKAANTVVPGTKAGSYDVVFSAQVPSQQPVVDSTTVTVLPGPMASHRFIDAGFICMTVFSADYVKDQYGNSVPYRMITTGPAAHVLSDVLGSEGARTFVADMETYVPDTATGPSVEPRPGQRVTVEVANGVTIATGAIYQTSNAPTLNCVSMWFAH